MTTIPAPLPLLPFNPRSLLDRFWAAVRTFDVEASSPRYLPLVEIFALDDRDVYQPLGVGACATRTREGEYRLVLEAPTGRASDVRATIVDRRVILDVAPASSGATPPEPKGCAHRTFSFPLPKGCEDPVLEARFDGDTLTIMARTVARQALDRRRTPARALTPATSLAS